MKKIYEVPAMEIVRLDASENIAKLPTIEQQGTNVESIGGSSVTTTRAKTKSLVNALFGSASSNIELN